MFWVLLVKICCRQTWLVEIIFSGCGRLGNISSKWARFFGMYQVLLYYWSIITHTFYENLQTLLNDEWNRHLLSSNKNNTLSGRSDVTYFLPHLYRNRRIYWYYQRCTVWLLWWAWWVCRDTDEWMKIIWECYMMHLVLLACIYIFWVNSRNAVKLP